MSDDGKIARSISIIGSIIAVAVTFNGLLSSCTQQRIDQHNAFRAAVGQEELFWKELYDDYLTTFSDEMDDDAEQRQAKLLALHSLAQRSVPSFEEFDPSEIEKENSREHLKQMKAVFLNALEEDGLASSQTIDSLKERSFQAAATQASTDLATARPSAGLFLNTNEVRRERFNVGEVDPDGWDLRFFWCPNADDPKVELFNYSQALTSANAFANLAESKRNIIPGTRIGSVQVAPVSDELRAIVNTDAERWVTWDEGPGEEAMANAVRDLVANTTNQTFGIYRSTGTPSPYYTSIFSCSPEIPSAGR